MQLDKHELFVVERGVEELPELQTMFGTRPGGFSKDLCGIIFEAGEVCGDFVVAIVRFADSRRIQIGHTMVINLREWVVFPVTRSFLDAALPKPEPEAAIVSHRDDVDLIEMIESDPLCSTTFLMGGNGPSESEEG
jgi:hypothetical protein